MFNKFGLLTILLPYYGFFEDWQDLLSLLSKGHYKTFKDYKKELLYLEGSMDKSKKIHGFEKLIKNNIFNCFEKVEFEDLRFDPRFKQYYKCLPKEHMIWDENF